MHIARNHYRSWKEAVDTWAVVTEHDGHYYHHGQEEFASLPDAIRWAAVRTSGPIEVRVLDQVHQLRAGALDDRAHSTLEHDIARLMRQLAPLLSVEQILDNASLALVQIKRTAHAEYDQDEHACVRFAADNALRAIADVRAAVEDVGPPRNVSAGGLK